jgi:hypothetical protein
MSDIPASQKMRDAEKIPAECGQKESSPVTEERLRKQVRGAAKVAGGAKSEPRVNKVRGEQGVMTRLVRKSAGRVETAKPSARGDGCVGEVVMSVGEREPTILRDPDNRKKRPTLAEALREHGLDETKVAAVHAGLVKKLSRNKDDGAVGVAAAKLLFDILRDMTHSHEPQKTVGSGDSSELPPFVRLIHNVPRPVRTE